ncbi:MAG TPA: hypothetical protein VIH25_05645 [Steroidobacteraceae bacterium]
MQASEWQRVIALIVTLNFILTACTSLQGVPLPGPDQPSATPAVKVGETVEVTTRAGEKLRFKVTSVETDALVGEEVRVAYADMASLQVERSDGARTGVAAWIVGGILLTAALIWAIDHLDEAGAAAAY